MSEGTAGRRAVKWYVKREAAQARAYSQAVITEGGKTIWLAGQVAAADASGRSLAGDFDSQVREVFSRLGHTIEEAGGTLADMVTIYRAAQRDLSRQFSGERADYRRRARPP